MSDFKKYLTNISHSRVKNTMVSLEKKTEKSHKLIHFEPQFQEMKKLENRNMN